jgi:hypothetical protein
VDDDDIEEGDIIKINLDREWALGQFCHGLVLLIVVLIIRTSGNCALLLSLAIQSARASEDCTQTHQVCKSGEESVYRESAYRPTVQVQSSRN